MNQFRKYIVSFTSVLHKATYKHSLSRYGINSKTVSFEICDKNLIIIFENTWNIKCFFHYFH